MEDYVGRLRKYVKVGRTSGGATDRRCELRIFAWLCCIACTTGRTKPRKRAGVCGLESLNAQKLTLASYSVIVFFFSFLEQ
jgi:hypothetical protein